MMYVPPAPLVIGAGSGGDQFRSPSPEGIASPPIQFASQLQTRPNRSSSLQHQQQLQQQPNPWAAAASNPHASISYYSQADSGGQPSALSTHPRIQFDSPPDTTYTIPSSSGMGMSPPPDEALSTMQLPTRDRLVKKAQQFKSRLGAERIKKWAAVAVALTSLILVGFVVVGRGGHDNAATTSEPVRAQELHRASSSRTYGRTAPENVSDIEESLLQRIPQRDLRTAVKQPVTDTPKKATAAKKPADGVFVRGMEEIAKLKASLKEMKRRWKEEVRVKLEAAEAEADSAEEDDLRMARAKAIESFKAEIDEAESKVMLNDTTESEENVTRAAAAIEEEDEEDSSSSIFEDDPPAKVVEPEVVGNSGAYDWLVSDWSGCSVTCGSGVQTRKLTCEDARTAEPVSIAKCAMTTLAPSDQQTCDLPACPKKLKTKRNQRGTRVAGKTATKATATATKTAVPVATQTNSDAAAGRHRPSGSAPKRQDKEATQQTKQDQKQQEIKQDRMSQADDSELDELSTKSKSSDVATQVTEVTSDKSSRDKRKSSSRTSIGKRKQS